MTSREKRKNAILTWLKNFFTKNLALKIIALLFAVLLWGYVLTDQKPLRTKIVAGVQSSFDGEAELIAQGFCVRGSREEILKDVSVTVRAQITNYAYITPSSINATVSLRNISEARMYELPVQAMVTSSLGVVQSITPATVDVEIDTLVTKTIPIATSFNGTLPEGYWADYDALSATARLDITGPKTDISTITRGECVVDLDGRTSTIYSTFDVTFYDKNDNVVSNDIIVGTLPTSTVRLSILPMKNVPLDVQNALVGTDNLAANHELVNAVATPASVRIVGDKDDLDAIESIAMEPISVNGMNETSTVVGELILPDGVRVLDTAPVSVLLEIREMETSQVFEKLEIEVVGEPPHTSVVLDIPSVDLTVDGRYSIVSILKRSDVQVQVDVTGLTPGTYSLPLNPFVKDEETTIELTTTLSTQNVTVTITSP